jgi:hypothetical protein
VTYRAVVARVDGGCGLAVADAEASGSGAVLVFGVVAVPGSKPLGRCDCCWRDGNHLTLDFYGG